MSRALTDLELMLILAIARIGDDAYGVPIAREIKATTGRDVALGVAYATLERLEQRGLVASTLGPPTPERGGRAKRFFRVTSKGLRAAKDMHKALSALWSGLPELKGHAL